MGFNIMEMKKILLLLIALSVPFIVSASEFAIVDVGRLWEIASETGGAMLKGLLQSCKEKLKP